MTIERTIKGKNFEVNQDDLLINVFFTIAINTVFLVIITFILITNNL